jgi:DNA-binding transcriptional LysR family regulator
MTFVQTPALALLSTALRELAETAPELRVEVTHSETTPAISALRSREVDLVVGIDYDPVPFPRHRDVDRDDLIREQVLLCIPGDHPFAAEPGPISLAAFEHAAWAADFPGSGHRTALEHLCNGRGGYAPDIVHHTDDALIMRALVASGRAVTILAALIAAATPQVAARPIAEGAVHRTIFTAARTSTVDAPAIQAVRAALRHAAELATAGRDDVALLAA